jgi:hypothetical protein
MSTNPFVLLKKLLPDAPLQVGTVSAVSGGTATITLPGGGTVTGRGSATVGAKVFVRDGVIEGAAPALPVELIDI